MNAGFYMSNTHPDPTTTAVPGMILGGAGCHPHGRVPQRRLALPFGSLGGLASHMTFSSVPEKGDGGYQCAKAMEVDVK